MKIETVNKQLIKVIDAAIDDYKNGDRTFKSVYSSVDDVIHELREKLIVIEDIASERGDLPF